MRPTAHTCAHAVLIASGAALSLSGGARAADRHWNNPQGGSYTTVTNWQETTFPGVTDIALFQIVPTYTVTFPSSQTNAGVSVGAGFPTFDLTGRTLDVNGALIVGTNASPARLGVLGGALTPNSGSVAFGVGSIARVDLNPGSALTIAGPLTLGGSGDGTLVMNSSTLACADAIVAQGSPSVASLMLGSGASFTASGEAFLGSAGDATIEIAGGSTMIAAAGAIASGVESTSSVLITGAGSRVQCGGEFVVGDAGDGLLEIESSGAVTSGQGTVGVEATSESIATLTGTGAVWNMGGAMQVGLRGKGAIAVTGGADIIGTAPGFFGVFDGGDGAGTVSGLGSSISCGGQLQVGREGKGRLTIEGGASVASTAVGSASGTAGIIGLQMSGDGGVTITGFPSVWTNAGGALVVGWGALGTLDIVGGGAATSVSGYVARNPGSIASVRAQGSGSRWTMSGSLRIGLDPSNAVGGAGTVTTLDGAMIQAADVTVGPFSTLGGNATVAAALVTNRGIVAPGGVAPGTLTIDGAYTQQAQGRLSIDIDQSGADRLAILDDVATLAGQLSITTPPGFAPANGTVYTIVSATSRVGTFSSVVSTPMPGGRSFSVAYNPSSVVLTVVVGPGCPGDANGDLVVDFVDLNIVLGSFGQMGGAVPGDVNNDGRVDFLDLNLVLSAYGTSC